MAAWLNEGRCPGGRPSVSTNYITIEASVFCIEMTTVHAIYEHRIKLAVSQKVPDGPCPNTTLLTGTHGWIAGHKFRLQPLTFQASKQAQSNTPAADFYFSSSFLTAFTSLIHPWIFSLSYWLCFYSDTSVFLHLLSGWASLHPGEELLRGSWEDSEVVATGSFTCFTKSWVGQVSCALQPTGMR